MKTKKILSIALAILMILGTFAVGASAATDLNASDILIAGKVIDGKKESYWLTVDGILTSNGASAINYNIAIAPAASDSAAKIILKNAQINKIAIFNGFYAGIASGNSFDIELQGTNIINVYPNENSKAHGVLTNNNLKVYGVGNLTVNVGNEKALTASGISGSMIDISEKAALTFNVKGVNSIDGGYSLRATTLSGNASLDINETCLKSASSSNGVQAIGYTVDADGLKLSDNAKLSVKMTDTNSAARSNIGIKANSNIELSGNSHINVNCCNASVSSVGILTNNGNLTVGGTSTVTATSGIAEYSCGINLSAEEDLKTTLTASGDSVITATANGGEEIYGIFAEGYVNAIDNSVINGTTKNTEFTSRGILVTSDITLSGSAKMNAVSSDCRYLSEGLFCTGTIKASEDSYINSKSGEGTEDGSCGIRAINLTMSDDAKILSTAKTGGSSFGILIDSNVTLTDRICIKGTADNATETSCGIYMYNLTARDMKSEKEHVSVFFNNGSLSGYAGNAQNSFGICCENADISGSVFLESDAGISTAKSCGFYVINEGNLDLTDATVTVSSNSSEIYTAGIFFENGDIKISGDSSLYVICNIADKSYGIVSDTFTVTNSTQVDVLAVTQAIYGAVPDFGGYEDAKIKVCTYSTVDSNDWAEWDGETPLGGDNSPYAGIFIEEANFFEKLTWFEKILLRITVFFAGIIEFFESLFSF